MRRAWRLGAFVTVAVLGAAACAVVLVGDEARAQPAPLPSVTPPAGVPSQLASGVRGIVSGPATTCTLRLRSEPSAANDGPDPVFGNTRLCGGQAVIVVTNTPPASTLVVTEGLVWWRVLVESTGSVGWVKEVTVAGDARFIARDPNQPPLTATATRTPPPPTGTAVPPSATAAPPSTPSPGATATPPSTPSPGATATPPSTPSPGATATPPSTPTPGPTPPADACGSEAPATADRQAGCGAYEVTYPVTLRPGESRSITLSVSLERAGVFVSVNISTPTALAGGTSDTGTVRVEGKAVYTTLVARLDAVNLDVDEKDWVTREVSGGTANWVWNVSAAPGARGKQSFVVRAGPNRENQVVTFRVDGKLTVQAAGDGNSAGMILVVIGGAIAVASGVGVLGYAAVRTRLLGRIPVAGRAFGGSPRTKRAVVISYRREDSSGWAGRIFDYLVERYGEDSVFIDIADIKGGEDFAVKLDRMVASADVVIPLIGPRWAGPLPGGGRRIDSPADFVRIEVAAALRQGTAVVPVLLDDMKMPAADELPPDLAVLSGRHAIEVTALHFHEDMALLSEAIENALVSGEGA
ncbi:MAG: toll/interleukin-1 receptor domain-containing protein [Dehalococcoidia bacterium]